MMYGFGDEQVPFTESVDLLRRSCSGIYPIKGKKRAPSSNVMYQRQSQ